MAKRRIKGIDIGLEIGKILKDYEGEIEREVALSSWEVGETVVQALQTSSDTPKLTGEYARGWRYDQVTSSYGLVHVTVYNETKPQLTHLLEFGHALRRGGRKVGDVKAFSHILSRRNLAEKLLMKKIEEQLK